MRFYCVIAVIAKHSDQSLILQEKRAEWIISNIHYLKMIEPKTGINQIELQIINLEEFFRLSLHIKKEGWINLPNKGWIHIVTSSVHDSPEIGDISLAFDNRSRNFCNTVHVCGGTINFETTKIKKLENIREFLNFFISDTDGIEWKRLK